MFTQPTGRARSFDDHPHSLPARPQLHLAMMMLSRVAERFRRLYNPEDPVTYKEGLLLCGFFWGRTLPAKAYALFSQFVWNLSIVHFLMKIVMEHEEIDTQVAMEALHWAVMNVLGSFGGIPLIINTSKFLRLHAMIKAGVFTYKTPLSQEQKKILSDENERIHFFVKVFFWLLTVAFVCTQLKGILFDHHEWGIQFPGWFPFKINSLGTYLVGFFYQLIMGYNLVMCAQGLCVSYTAISGHFCSQLRILSISIQDLFKGPRMDGALEERLKACIQHHYRIVEFYTLMQDFYDIMLLVMAGCMVTMFCLVGYVVTDPESELIVIIPLLSVFIPEMVIVSYFCYAGQKIMDESEHLSQTIYETEWYREAPHIRRDLVLMLLKSQRTFKLTGGRIQNFNLQGLSEILQASYTYFNMLVALRKK